MEASILNIFSKLIITQGVPTALVLFVCFLVYRLIFFETVNEKGEKVHTNILQTLLASFNRLVTAVEDLGTNFQTHDVRVNTLSEKLEEVKDNQRCTEHLKTLQEIKQEMAKEKTLKELESKINKKK